MTRTSAISVVLMGLCLGCAGVSRSSNTSGNSSNTSGNSSGQSGNSSGQSANSSGASNASSQNSSGSSAQSSDQSRNSATSVQSSQASTNASSESSGASSSVVAGSALLLGVAGGILTTVFTVKHRREARLQREQLRQLQQAPQPQPMPYKVEPIPLQPGTQPPPAAPPIPHSRHLEEAPPTLDAMVLARSWLEANRLQLAHDLALGAGPAVDDLAGISGIAPAHRAHFGRVLQRHRAELLPPRDLTPRQAAELMSRVGDLVMSDPALREDAVAALAGSTVDQSEGSRGPVSRRDVAAGPRLRSG